MDIVNTSISVIGGALAGFLTSFFFWKKERKLQRPRLFLEKINEDQSGIILGFINKGGSYAERVVFNEYHMKKLARNCLCDNAIPPNGKEVCARMDIDENIIIDVRYNDVYGKKYYDCWNIHTSCDGGEWSEPFISKIEKFEQII